MLTSLIRLLFVLMWNFIIKQTETNTLVLINLCHLQGFLVDPVISRCSDSGFYELHAVLYNILYGTESYDIFLYPLSLVIRSCVKRCKIGAMCCYCVKTQFISFGIQTVVKEVYRSSSTTTVQKNKALKRVVC